MALQTLSQKPIVNVLKQGNVSYYSVFLLVDNPDIQDVHQTGSNLWVPYVDIPLPVSKTRINQKFVVSDLVIGSNAGLTNTSPLNYAGANMHRLALYSNDTMVTQFGAIGIPGILPQVQFHAAGMAPRSFPDMKVIIEPSMFQRARFEIYPTLFSWEHVHFTLTEELASA